MSLIRTSTKVTLPLVESSSRNNSYDKYAQKCNSITGNPEREIIERFVSWQSDNAVTSAAYQNISVNNNGGKSTVNNSNGVKRRSPTHVNLPLMAGIPNLPPRPVPLARKISKCSNQRPCEPLKSVNGGRCISPSSNQNKQVAQTTNGVFTLKRHHVLHRSCSLNSTNLEALERNGPPVDIVIVYSKECRVSTDWARYFKSLFDNASYSSSYLSSMLSSRISDISCDSSSSTSSIPKVELQDIEAFSNKIYKINSSSDDRYVLVH